MVDCNFFGHPDDLRLTLASLEHARRLLKAEPFGSKLKEELLPGAGTVGLEELTSFCASTVKTNYHPVGTAPMGFTGDGASVVDHELRVYGVRQLRVIDCSIMPAIVSGNTNAPAMAIGSKAAELIGSNRRTVSAIFPAPSAIE